MRVVTTCSEQSGVESLSTQTGKFIDLLFGPSAAIARRIGSWMQSVNPSVTCVPSRIGQLTGDEPHVFESPWFQMCVIGTVSRPLATSLSGSLLTFARSGCTRAAIADTRAGSLLSVQYPAAYSARIASALMMLASATIPAGAMPCCCIDHATPNVPAEPALVPCRN